MKKINVGFLMSYDYNKLKYSLPPVYKTADSIYLALDKYQRTWKGNRFEIDISFFEWLKAFDLENKIIIYRDNFYVSEFDPMKNEIRERFLLSKKMGIGNWLIQVDADEIFIDFDKYVKTLRKYNSFLENPAKQPIQIAGFLLNIYKYLDNGILFVNNPTKVMLATNYPNYKHGRNTKQRVIYTNNILLHECLSRSEEELQYKLNNWGHSHQINNEFLYKWKQANEINYKELKDLFYLDPTIWKRLDYFPSKNLDKIKDLVDNDQSLALTKFFLMKKNFGQWFKFLKVFKKSKIKFESYF
jgi:hypothetical protein